MCSILPTKHERPEITPEAFACILYLHAEVLPLEPGVLMRSEF